MKALPLLATAFSPWQPLRNADRATQRAAARTLCDTHSSGAVSLAMKVDTDHIVGQLGVTALGATDRDAQQRSRRGLSRQGLEEAAHVTAPSLQDSFSAFLCPMSLPTKAARPPSGNGFRAVRAELAAIAAHVASPAVTINLRVNHPPAALLAALDLAADFELTRSTLERHRPIHIGQPRPKQATNLSQLIAQSAPRLTLTGWVTAEEPIHPVLLQRMAYAFSEDLGQLVTLVPRDAPRTGVDVPLSTLGELLGLVSPFADPPAEERPLHLAAW